MKTAVVVFLAFVGAASVAPSAYAGPYSNALSKCLVASTSDQDRTQLVRWIFLVLAEHPALKSIAANDATALESADKSVADLMTRLVTESCRTQTRKVIKYEGTEAMKNSFGVLGRVAVKNLFSNPQVSRAMSGFAKYLDKKKLESVSGHP